ncbi:VOC family protein [Micromonospora sp. PLK6-60]|uniref:VOC family protein n=1 Tax=Micromonospora sp. PLK6-60 TaxID=2873383 RepID=UPI001CA6D8AF|nr:VOC family protein [Micromonospora sp. PLK6-60]MBY8870465.1 VOC family protein [Micromonospora sp. PLK6-60]
MGSIVRHITFDLAAPHEPYELARFWSGVLGYPICPEDQPGDDEVALDVPAGQPTLLFLRVPEAKTLKNRVHLDLEPDQPRDAEVDRIAALGATVVDDQRTPNGRGWMVFADPAGNEFCVEISGAEKEAIIRQAAAAATSKD